MSFGTPRKLTNRAQLISPLEYHNYWKERVASDNYLTQKRFSTPKLNTSRTSQRLRDFSPKLFVQNPHMMPDVHKSNETLLRIPRSPISANRIRIIRHPMFGNPQQTKDQVQILKHEIEQIRYEHKPNHLKFIAEQSLKKKLKQVRKLKRKFPN